STRQNIPSAFILLALLLGLLLSSPTGFANEKKPEVKVLSAEELRDIVRDNKGKVLILNFWSTLNSMSRQVIPFLNTLCDTYKDKELEIIGINVEGVEPGVIEPFVERMQINYPVFMGRDGIIQAYDIQFTPVTFILGKDGRVRMKEMGFNEDTKSKFRKLINTLIREG
ncbi:MAG: TlpA disulfide reductase family protein, partial [Candidatus Brocadiales bacterium]